MSGNGPIGYPGARPRRPLADDPYTTPPTGQPQQPHWPPPHGHQPPYPQQPGYNPPQQPYGAQEAPGYYFPQAAGEPPGYAPPTPGHQLPFGSPAPPQQARRNDGQG